MSLLHNKLLELLDALESLRDQGSEEVQLDAETIDQLSYMETFARAWLQDESPLTEEERVAVLAKLTDALKPKFLVSETLRRRNTLH